MNGPALQESPGRNPGKLSYLLLPLDDGQDCWQHCLWQQAPRLRLAAARAMIAAILVMVMINFASFVSWLP